MSGKYIVTLCGRVNGGEKMNNNALRVASVNSLEFTDGGSRCRVNTLLRSVVASMEEKR